MNRIKIVLCAFLPAFFWGVAQAKNFSSSGTGSVVAPGVYDELCDDGSANLGVIRDGYGMLAGLPEGAVVDYSGSEKLTYAAGFYVRPKSGSITGLGDLYADITMKFDAFETYRTDVAGILMWKSSQGAGKSVYVDKIRVTANTNASGNKTVAATGIYNMTSNIGDITGSSGSSEIRAESSSFTSQGIYVSYSASVGNISDIGIYASSTGGSAAYGIKSESGSSKIGNLKNVSIGASASGVGEAYGIYNMGAAGDFEGVKINASGQADSYGIYNLGGNVGAFANAEISAIGNSGVYGIMNDWSGSVKNLTNASITAKGGFDTIGIYNCEGVIGGLSGVNVSASGNGFAAGICLGEYGDTSVLSFENSSSVSAESAGGQAYSIANESSETLTLAGDETMHTLAGDIYSKGGLLIDGNFMLKDASIELGGSMTLFSGACLSWNGVLEISGGPVNFESGAELCVYLDDAALSGERLILLSEEGLTVTAAAMDLHVYASSAGEISGCRLEYRETESGGALYVVVPEPALAAAFAGLFAAAFAFICRRRARG